MAAGSDPDGLARFHLRLGWWGLVLFAAGGVGLETLHGLKAGFYLDVGEETRRMMWRLAHAHGALLSVVHVVFGLTVPALPGFAPAARTLASRCLLGGLVMMPLGFALGGLSAHGGDPGLGVLLVPAGAIMLLVGLGVTAAAASR